MYTVIFRAHALLHGGIVTVTILHAIKFYKTELSWQSRTYYSAGLNAGYPYDDTGVTQAHTEGGMVIIIQWADVTVNYVL